MSSASSSKPTDSSSKSSDIKKEDSLHLGVLEEDDEFEEFAAAGK